MTTNALSSLVDVNQNPLTAKFLTKASETKLPEGYVNPSEMMGVDTELSQRQAKAQEDVNLADINIERAKQEQKIKEQEIDVQAKKEQAKAIAGLPEGERLKEKREEMKNLKFVPDQLTAKDFATVFSLINVIGMAVGGGGRTSAVNAMAAMDGMAQGYQQGRTDLYKQQAQEFDKNFKALQQSVTTLEKEYSDAVERTKTDSENGRLERQLALSKAGSPIFKAMEQKQGVVKTLETIKQTREAIDKAAKKLDEIAKIKFQSAEKEKQENARFEHEKQIAKIKATSGTKSDRYGFGDILATASNEAAASMRNIMSLPVESTSGIFGGKQTNSLFTAPVDAFANKITNESTQRYNTEASKLSYNLAQLMKGGRQVGVGETAVMDNVIKIKEGDSIETAATKLAEARQMAERAIEVRIKSPNTPPELKEIYKENLETIKSVIPFTVDDINNFVKEKDGSTTFAESLSKKYEPKSEEHPKDIEDIMKKYGG